LLYSKKGNVMRYVCLFALMLPLLSAQDGAGIYKERCAACHDMPQARVPSLATIKAMSAEAIYVALTNGVMKSRAEGLSTAQIFALIGYIAPTGGAQAAPSAITPTCQGDAAFRPGATAPQWNGWSPSVTNSRFADAATASLAASDVPKLKVKWAFNLGAVTMARSQPVIVGGRVFLASQTGAVYALDADSGCTRWGFQAAPGLRGGITIGESNGTPAVFFSDAGGTAYALNAQTGTLLWKVRPVDHFATMATATPRYYKGVIYQPYASFEEALLHVSRQRGRYRCCDRQEAMADVHHSGSSQADAQERCGNAAVRAFGRKRLVQSDDRRAAWGSLCRDGRQLFGSADQHE
jgi:polyvinyl alcohol dehydrogenase (cytochrome)